MSSNSRDGSTRGILRVLRRAGSCAIAEPPVIRISELGAPASMTDAVRAQPAAASPDRLVVCAPGQGWRAHRARDGGHRTAGTTYLDEVPEGPDGQAVSNAEAIPAMSPSGGRAEEAHHDHLAPIGCGRRPGRAD